MLGWVTSPPDWVWPSTENLSFPVEFRLLTPPRKPSAWHQVPGRQRHVSQASTDLPTHQRHSTDVYLKSATRHFFSETMTAPQVSAQHPRTRSEHRGRQHLCIGSPSLRCTASHLSCLPKHGAQSCNSLSHHGNVEEPSFITRGLNPRVPARKDTRPWTTEATNHSAGGTWADTCDKWPSHSPPWRHRPSERFPSPHRTSARDNVPGACWGPEAALMNVR